MLKLHGAIDPTTYSRTNNTYGGLVPLSGGVSEGGIVPTYTTPMPQQPAVQQAPSQPVYGMPNFNYTPSYLLQQQLSRSNQQFNNPITAPRGWNNAPALSILPKLSYESQGQQAPALSNGGLLGK
jgi:hypothetical protein